MLFIDDVGSVDGAWRISAYEGASIQDSGYEKIERLEKEIFDLRCLVEELLNQQQHIFPEELL